jgi:hypothetical protein
MIHRVFKLNEYSAYTMGQNPDLNIDTEILDALVDIVGSEEDVESAAEESFNELMSAFENDEIEASDEMVPEKLALAALVVKLVELGKLGPEEADSFIEEYLD